MCVRDRKRSNERERSHIEREKVREEKREIGKC